MDELEHTKVNNIAFKGLPKLLLVDLEHAPVLSKAFCPDVEGKR